MGEDKIKIKKKYKEFQVDYLRLFKEKFNDDDEVISNEVFKLSKYLGEFASIPVEERFIRYNNEVIRLQSIEKFETEYENLKECKKLWIIHFIRIKTNFMSGIATEDGEYDEKLLNEKLSANQYLADSTGCIYDEDKELLIVARNRDAVLPSAILEFFKKTLKEKGLVYAVIPNNIKFKKSNTSIYRRLVVGINDVKSLDKKEKHFLEKNIPSVFNAIKSFNGCGYYNIKIELSMGDSPKNKGMNNEKIQGLGYKLMESGIKNINKIEIDEKESADTKVETIDLINNKIKDKFKIGYSRKEPILYNHIINNLLKSYNNKKNKLDDLIK